MNIEQIPVTPETLPSQKVVDFTRWALERNRQRQDKRDRLNPDQLAFIRRRARQANCHILAAFEMQEAGYSPPVALEPEDERSAMQREFVQAVKALEVIQGRMARLGVSS